MPEAGVQQMASGPQLKLSEIAVHLTCSYLNFFLELSVTHQVGAMRLSRKARIRRSLSEQLNQLGLDALAEFVG